MYSFKSYKKVVTYCLVYICLCSCMAQPAPVLPTTWITLTPSPTPTTQVLPTMTPTATSAVIVSTPPPTETSTPPACEQQNGRIEIGSLQVENDSYPLDFRVYLPPCYDEKQTQFYPTLYLIHGQGFTDDQWDRLGVDEKMDELITMSEFPPFLVVMPRDYKWDPPDVDPFGESVTRYLVPYIDQTYRTIPDRSFRAVGGLSRGAGWSLHIGLEDWQEFGALGLHSLAVLWGDVPDLKRWLAQIPPEAMPRIYMDVGNNDFAEIIQPTLWFEELLSERGIAHEFYLFSGAHVESYWRAHIEQYLRWYAMFW